MKAIFNKFTIIFSLLLVPAFVFVSCNDFLAERPSKSTSVVVTTTAQLDALLSTYSSFYTEANRAAICGNDDYGYIADMQAAYNGIYGGSGITGLFAGCWNYEYLANATSDQFWTNEWGKIFRANLVLNSLDKVSGSDADKARLKADAHFIRAYSYWNLANTYCLPYTAANKGELGLPLKKSTSFEESMARASLEDTYKFIEADIQEALKCTKPLVKDGVAEHWRASTAGVNGFLARYYLNQNNYTEALNYANNALGEYSALVDYNTEMRYGNDGTETIDKNTPQEQSVTIKYPYTHDNQLYNEISFSDIMAWKEHLYFRTLYHGSWYYIPSQELLALYDQTNDLRYKYHMVQHYSYNRGAVSPSYDYPGYIFFFKDNIPNGPSTSEMYLIKAECQARSGNYNDAMTTLNILRAKRLVPGAWVNLSATSKDDAIRQILEERRREKPFTLRWYDLRRFNNNDDPNDDVVVTRTFYPFSASAIFTNDTPITYTLEKNSRKYALPIFNGDIIAGMGALQQNTY